MFSDGSFLDLIVFLVVFDPLKKRSIPLREGLTNLEVLIEIWRIFFFSNLGRSAKALTLSLISLALDLISIFEPYIRVLLLEVELKSANVICRERC